ncbi:hypothetical protein RBB50_010350 [Rhinocladiella similis]
MTEPPSSVQSRRSLFSLPAELYNQIIPDLNYQDLLSFRLTCRFATGVIPFARLKTLHRMTKQTLLEDEKMDLEAREVRYAIMEQWALAFPNAAGRNWNSHDNTANIHTNRVTRAGYLNCYACLQNLPRECFTRTQTMGKRSLGHRDCGRRFCKACGVKKGIWEKGTTIRDDKHTWTVCKGCNSLREADPKHKRAGVCSAECLAVVTSATPDRTSTFPEAGQNQLALPPISDTIRNRTSSTRATRCLRCWSIDHTEKVADGQRVLHLCKDCESVVNHGILEPKYHSNS